MHPVESVLYERICTVINEKWCQEGSSIFDLPAAPALASDRHRLVHKNYFDRLKSTESIERLKRRMEELEQQNDQLLHFINFLVENLPELVITILNTGQETQSQLDQPVYANKLPCAADYCQNNNQPCPTRREKDVLELLAKGLCAKEIANTLFISETTVVTHKKNLKEKFNARNTAELISKAQPHLSKDYGSLHGG